MWGHFIMGKGRLEAFSDGVIAVIITIMVLELKAPHGASLQELYGLWPTFLSYVLSFVFVGIYWNNHHHLLHTVKHVTGGMMWANMFLLFWLSLVPFTTSWMGDNQFSQWPVFLYSINLIGAAIGFTVLVQSIIHSHGPDSTLAKAVGSDKKGKISLAAYVVAAGLSFVNPYISCALFVAVSLIWLMPDKRIESVIK